MTRVSSAVKQGQRPTAALKELSNPHKGWVRLDYIIQDAYFLLEKEVCGICKNPIWLCHSTDNNIDFLVKTRTCYAKAELDDFEKSPRGKNLDSGEYTIAVPTGIDDLEGGTVPLPTRTQAYETMQTD